ncbi:MAG: hypothetical protein ACOCR1_05310 [Planctomycetota bacterium]
MSKPANDGILWIIMFLFAAAGFFVRLHLDDRFENYVPEDRLDKAGLIDSFMLEATRDLVITEGENDDE